MLLDALADRHTRNCSTREQSVELIIQLIISLS